jgi:hypothetical protein
MGSRDSTLDDATGARTSQAECVWCTLICVKYWWLPTSIASLIACTVGAVVVVGGCGDERDAIIKEYVDKGVNLTPACADFTQAAKSEFFTFKQLTVNDPHSWALIREPLVVGKRTRYGLDKWRQEYGSARITNSVYRSPIKNETVGGAPQSRHMHGDAADLRNETGKDPEYDAMVTAAQNARADYIEPISGPCKKACVHADWRDTTGAYSK